MHILHVVGARPNFMKAAPVIHALGACGVRQTLVHTGQHYDRNLSDVFFSELDMRPPDVNLEVGSGGHSQQTAAIMSRFEPVLVREKPDWVVVYGDVNSTVAVALVCSKENVRLAHVEAGLRSFDRTMPEEINRIVTDQLADLLFTPSEDGDANLLREGIRPDRICRVGNVMIDTLVQFLPKAIDRFPLLRSRFSLGPYGLVTLHRPSNVDDPSKLKLILGVLQHISRQVPLIFPMHPRTRRNLEQTTSTTELSGLVVTEPLSYLDCLALQSQAKFVITDSGGLQEETTYLGIPCFTLRPNTERPITITMGTNVLIDDDFNRLKTEVSQILSGRVRETQKPPLWDGRASHRIADFLLARSAKPAVASAAANAA